MRINWRVFWTDSSSSDSVADFACGMSFAKGLDGIWDPQARKEFRKLKKLTLKSARRRAARACDKHFAYWR